MNDLEKIWNQISIEQKTAPFNIKNREEAVFNQLEKEAKLKKQYLPFGIFLVFLVTLLFGFIVKTNSSNFDSFKLLGVLCIGMSGLFILYFTQVVKMPIKKFQYEKTSVDFLREVRLKLNKTRINLIAGTILQILALSGGLYFTLLYGNENLSQGHYFLFLGCTCGLLGLGVGGAFKLFNDSYRHLYWVVDHFLEEDNA